jgi:hypothetical protein
MDGMPRILKVSEEWSSRCSLPLPLTSLAPPSVFFPSFSCRFFSAALFVLVCAFVHFFLSISFSVVFPPLSKSSRPACHCFFPSFSLVASIPSFFVLSALPFQFFFVVLYSLNPFRLMLCSVPPFFRWLLSSGFRCCSLPSFFLLSQHVCLSSSSPLSSSSSPLCCRCLPLLFVLSSPPVHLPSAIAPVFRSISAFSSRASVYFP